VKVSVIVTTYKDLISLGLVLDGLKRQDYKNFEVIVAEDDNAKETVCFLEKYKKELNITHVSHPDMGRTKTKIQNQAIKVSNGEYLIFLDGDVIPYRNFISSQLKIAKRKRVLSGRRVNLNEKITQKIKKGKINPLNIEKYYWFYALFFIFDKTIRFEQGFYISPNSWIYKKILQNRKRNTAILGCNWSCFKEDFVAINGFDEGYIGTSIGEDTDLTWRFEMAGYEIKSSKNIANVLHLYHNQSDFLGATNAKEQLQKRVDANCYICQKGILEY